MIDFACKQFDLNDIIKCGLGLTRAEMKIFNHFIVKNGKEFTTAQLSKQLNLELTTIQKAVKKLHSKGIIERHQKNLKKGGYQFTYQCKPRQQIRKVLKEIINNWSDKVIGSIEKF